MSEQTPDTPAQNASSATRPRRRAVSRPAGPPADTSATSGTGTSAGSSSPTKRTRSRAGADTGSTAAKATAKSAAKKQVGKTAMSPATSDSSAKPAAGAPRSKAPVLTPIFQAPDAAVATPTRTRKKATSASEAAGEGFPAQAGETDASGEGAGPRKRRRGGRGRGGGKSGANADQSSDDVSQTSAAEADDADGDDESASSSSRRRRRRRRAGGEGGADADDAADANTVTHVRSGRAEAQPVRGGSVRLEARKQRRRDSREGKHRRTVITEAEFLARRESVERTMVVRDRAGITQIGVLEDGVLVEHYVTQAGSTSLIGNVYLGRVQNVLPSMEAAFIDIGRGRNGVLYAGEVNWDLLGVPNGDGRRIENVLKSGDTVLVQVSKDPVGQKGARLTSMVSLPGRYVVYVPNSATTGISRKLPENERNRLKDVLRAVLPEDGGVIVRTAAEGASEEELSRDVTRLLAQWEDIQAKSKSANAPALLYAEPDMTIKVVRDIFNEDVRQLKVSGLDAFETLEQYIGWVAPDLLPRLEKWVDVEDIFTAHRVDEQLAKALDRKVFLPSGGSLVIDRTEAMTVVDVNTGRFIGSGGNLEETVTKNNLEAAEEIVRQLRLRDIGGIIVIDFIDMVLESNRQLVLRRLIECLGRDRTKHQVAEVTSLGLVQMTRKRLSQGLLEVFSESCQHCNGRGVIISTAPSPVKEDKHEPGRDRGGKTDTHGSGNRAKGGAKGKSGKSTSGTSKVAAPASEAVEEQVAG